MLEYTAGHINYGGRVTDDWDRRCIMNILADYYHMKVISGDHQFDTLGVYHQVLMGYDLRTYFKIELP